MSRSLLAAVVFASVAGAASCRTTANATPLAANVPAASAAVTVPPAAGHDTAWMQITEEVTVAASPARLWAWCVEPARLTQWAPVWTPGSSARLDRVGAECGFHDEWGNTGTTVVNSNILRIKNGACTWSSL